MIHYACLNHLLAGVFATFVLLACTVCLLMWPPSLDEVDDSEY